MTRKHTGTMCSCFNRRNSALKSLEELAKEEAVYVPSSSVQTTLQHVHLICVVGGAAVGKNYLMQLSGIPIVGRVTSRPQRPDDDPSIYKFFTNNELIEKIERGKLVQYAVDLPNQVIYGSVPDDYVQNGPTLADIWHWSVDMLKDKGFGSVKAVSIITPWEQWKAQLEARFAARDESYRLARLEEARKSLEWTRSRLNDPNHAVIINDKNYTEESVNLLKDFANGDSIQTPTDASALIDELLRQLPPVVTS